MTKEKIKISNKTAFIVSKDIRNKSVKTVQIELAPRQIKPLASQLLSHLKREGEDLEWLAVFIQNVT